MPLSCKQLQFPFTKFITIKKLINHQNNYVTQPIFANVNAL